MNSKHQTLRVALSRLSIFFFIVLCASLLSESASLAATAVLGWQQNSEPEVVGYKVYYKENSTEFPFDGAGAIQGVAPVDVANQTTATLTGLNPASDYYFVVTAYDASGVESPYSEIFTLPAMNDTAAPSASLTSPVAGATVNGTVAITATAGDDIGINKIELLQNGNIIASGNLSPLSYNWDTTQLSNGAYTLTVRAYDAAGNLGLQEMTVNVLNDVTAPTISFLAPTNTYVYGSSTTISASATDNGQVSMIELYLDGVLTTKATSSSFSVPVSLAKGIHTVTVKAYDANNNVATATRSINRIF